MRWKWTEYPVAILFIAAVATLGISGGRVDALTDAEARAALDEVQRLAGEQAYTEARLTFAVVKSNRPEAIEAIDGLKMAVVMAIVGNEAALLTHSRWLLDRYAGSMAATDAERSVKGYLVYPGEKDPELLARAVERARFAVEQAVAAGDSELLPWFHVSLGIAEFRAGDYAAAAKWLCKGTDNETLYIRGLALPFAAMTARALGNPAEAEELLNRARETAAELPEPGTGEYIEEWTDTEVIKMAMAEAEADLGNTRLD
jgi:tetratricopeptide (TPR) repeat protein